jgi:hypothetical protein
MTSSVLSYGTVTHLFMANRNYHSSSPLPVMLECISLVVSFFYLIPCCVKRIVIEVRVEVIDDRVDCGVF